MDILSESTITCPKCGSRETVSGHFCIQFIRTTSRNATPYRYAGEKTAFNRVNTTNGDQVLLLSK